MYSKWFLDHLLIFFPAKHWHCLKEEPITQKELIHWHQDLPVTLWKTKNWWFPCGRQREPYPKVNYSVKTLQLSISKVYSVPWRLTIARLRHPFTACAKMPVSMSPRRSRHWRFLECSGTVPSSPKIGLGVTWLIASIHPRPCRV